MSALKMGELFAGYGGLGMGVAEVLDVDLAWVSEFDKGPSKVLTHRFPGVPNHGDITKIDWSQVEPVDVLTGGSPCQDLSHAGARKGMTEGTRSNLWVAMREAIAQLRPGLVVWENVRGAYSAEATSSGTVVKSRERRPGGRSSSRVVYEGGLLENADGGPTLRALGRVLGDLSDLGYDAQWHGLRAADVGAPHGRFRVFVVAYPKGDAGRILNRNGGAAGHSPFAARRGAQQQHLREVSGQAAEPGEPTSAASLLPTPTVSDSNGAGAHGDGGLDLRTAITTLLPTPAVNDMGASYTPDERDAWTDRMKAEHGNGNGHGKSLHIEAARLLPTPMAAEGQKAVARQSVAHREDGGHHVWLTNHAHDYAQTGNWGQYAAAINRWESLTRPAPAPTETGPKGNPRLSAAFSEWMMGLPAGWITDVPGITRNEALRLAGNGVVPQQCAAALRIMLAQIGEVAA